MFGILISACKKAITGRWLLPESPTIQEWIDTVNDTYVMERIACCLCLQKDTFVKLWTKWVKYIRPLWINFMEVTNCGFCDAVLS